MQPSRTTLSSTGNMAIDKRRNNRPQYSHECVCTRVRTSKYALSSYDNQTNEKVINWPKISWVNEWVCNLIELLSLSCARSHRSSRIEIYMLWEQQSVVELRKYILKDFYSPVLKSFGVCCWFSPCGVQNVFVDRHWQTTNVDGVKDYFNISFCTIAK